MSHHHYYATTTIDEIPGTMRLFVGAPSIPGSRSGPVVMVERLRFTDHSVERRYRLALYLSEVSHSPDGYEWGYGGSGPSQLAYAMLRELYGRRFSERHYQLFKRDVVAKLRRGKPWSISEYVVRRVACEIADELADETNGDCPSAIRSQPAATSRSHRAHRVLSICTASLHTGPRGSLR